MAATYARYRQIRVADNLNDQATSAQISNALTASQTEEDLQYYFLSRLRQVIFGNTSVHHWYEDFLSEGILSLQELSASSSAVLVRTGIPLVGLKNGQNRIFRTTPDYFVHDPTVTGQDISVFHNGRRLILTAAPDPGQGDFFVSESGGLGTGYDTVTMLTFAPVTASGFVADYQIAFP